MHKYLSTLTWMQTMHSIHLYIFFCIVNDNNKYLTIETLTIIMLYDWLNVLLTPHVFSVS